MGFGMKPSQPVTRAVSRSLRIVLAVSATMSVASMLAFWRSFVATSKPERPGRLMSRRIKAGFNARAISQPFRPSSAQCIS